MTMNKYQPHLIVIPEDDANRQMINGFLLDHGVVDRNVHVEREAGGWSNVLSQFSGSHVAMMNKYSQQYTVLLIDFDQDRNRLAKAQDLIPDDLKGRVFVLGVWSNPEKLKSSLAQRISFEKIGRMMAEDCKSGKANIWDHELLRHNAGELARLRALVSSFLLR